MRILQQPMDRSLRQKRTAATKPQMTSNTGVRKMEYVRHHFTAMTVLEEMYLSYFIEAYLQKFSRNRARTPPDAYSISSADFSSSTRPLDPAAPPKYQYNT